MSRHEFDVVIAGGGIAGSVCAAALSRRGIRALLFEKSSFSAPRIGEVVDAVLFSLLVAELRIEPAELEPVAAERAEFHVRWGGEHDPTGVRAPQTHLRIDRVELDRRLFQHAAACGVTTWTQATELKVERISDGWTWLINVNGEVREVRSRFAVEATGRTGCAKFSERGRIAADRAIACSLRRPYATDSLEDDCVRIESAEDGWWYSSRLPTRERLLVSFTDRDLLPANAIERSRWLFNRLQATLGVREVWESESLEAGASLSWRRHDARMSIRTRSCGEGWLTVGDAQMSLDPLSGMGMPEAARSALAAVPFIQDALECRHVAQQAFAQTVAARYNHRLAERARHYELERQWPTAEYWRRRHTLARPQSESLR